MTYSGEALAKSFGVRPDLMCYFARMMGKTRRAGLYEFNEKDVEKIQKAIQILQQ